MPPANEIQQYLTGAWRMMWGQKEGLSLLDLSVDGFWNSFFAIVIAAPVLLLGWVAFTNEFGSDAEILSGRISLMGRLLIADLAAWIIPIAGLAIIAPRAGIGDRFVPYVVASNWGSAVSAWITLPPVLIRLFLPDQRELSDLLSLALLLFVLVLGWRLAHVALARNATVTTAVYVAMIFATFSLLFFFQDLFGLVPPDVNNPP